MVLFLLKAAFMLLGILSNLITRLIFQAAAQVVVQLVQNLRLAGEGGLHVLELVRDVTGACIEFSMKFFLDVIVTVLSSMIEVVKEGILNGSSGFASTVCGLVENSRAALDSAGEGLAELLSAFGEMSTKVFGDVWNNWIEAVQYVTENVLKS